MSKAWLTVVAVGLVVLGFGAGRASSQDAGADDGKADGAEAQGPTPEQTAAWVKYMTPGPEHQRLAAMAGEWRTVARMWTQPGSPCSESTGTAKIRMILGGRFQVRDYAGTMGGMPFEGLAVVGFDNAKGEHLSTWCDSMGTALLHARGKADDKGAVTYTGRMSDPLTGGDYTMREVVTVKDKDTILSELFMSGGGVKEEFRMLEITYTRKKP